MKYLLFWEQKEMPTGERTKLSSRARSARQDEERFGVEVLPPHFTETGKGITVVDIVDPKQLANRMALVAPFTTIEAVPLIRSTMFSESVQELQEPAK